MRHWMATIVTLLCSLTASAHDFEVDGIYYNITSDTEVEVTNYAGTEYYINIPVTVIYDGVEYSVTSIGNNAFMYCRDLTCINIPESVTNIGGNAFRGCSSLTTITLPKGVTSIENNVFMYCSSLTSIALSENVTRIGYEAFCGCSSLTSIIFPEGLEYIGQSSFYECRSLASITIPESVTWIGGWAFSDCSSLTSMVVAEENTKYDSRNNCNAIIETSSNTLTHGCSATIIPESVTSIEDWAFYKCRSLTTITIPEGVTSIGDCAFCECISLTDITIPKSVIGIGERTFSDCSSLTSMVVSKGNTKYDSRNNCNAIIETSSNTLTHGCSATIIPEGVTSIGDYAFYNCLSLTAITCKAVTPPTIGASETFYAVDKSIPVYVPAGSVEAYKAADVWSEFTNYQPIYKEYTLKVSDAGYATLYLDYAVAIPEAVEVYIASSVEDDRLMMTKVEGVLPANTGVIVKAKPGDYTFVESNGTLAEVEGSMLTGTTTDTYITAESGYKYYVLAKKDGVVGMYRPKLTDGQFLNNANKAYLALESSDLGIFDDETNTEDEGGQLSNRLRFDFGGATGIVNSEFRIHNSELIYDLTGRRVENPTKQGIYIVNGRKVVMGD